MEEMLLRLGPQDAGMQLSSREFGAALLQDPYIYERVKGRLVVMSPAGPEHRMISRPFRRELGGFWSQHSDIVDDVDVEGWVSTSEHDDRIPDICVYLAGETSGQEVPHRVPDIIFEFVSASRSDHERVYIDKREEYHAIGVKEYVIVDRFKQAVLVLTWQPTDFAEHWIHRENAYSTELLPGLKVDLSEVFPDRAHL